MVTSQPKAYFGKKKLLFKPKSKMLGVARRCPMGGAQNARLTQLHVLAETTSIICNAVFSDLFACASELLSETPPRLPKNKQGSLVTGQLGNSWANWYFVLEESRRT